MDLQQIKQTIERLLSRKNFYHRRSGFCSKAEGAYHEVEILKSEIKLLKQILEFGREAFLNTIVDPINLELKHSVSKIVGELVVFPVFNLNAFEQRWLNTIEYLEDELTKKQSLLDELEEEEIKLERILYFSKN